MDDFNIQAIFSKVKNAVSDFFTPETIISKKPQQQSIYPLIQDLENKSKVGWTGQYWTPHESKEGGTDTIAYGHKLTDKEQQGNYVMINGEQVPFNKLTEQKAQQLFAQDWKQSEGIAKNWFGDDWNKVDYKIKSLATELVYNMGDKVTRGKSEYKNFKRKAISGEDYLSEIGRGYYEDGEFKQLTSRVEQLRDWAR